MDRLDADNLYKTILKEYFWDALVSFMPNLYEAADRNVPPVPLDEELQKVTFDLDGGASRADLLMSVTLAGGGEEYLLCHVEVQGEGGGDLPLRMYRYKEAIHLLYGKEPAGIAVITARRPRGEKTAYSSDVFGVRVSYDYKNFFVLETPDDELLSGENKVGLFLYAAKCAYESGGDEGEKFRYLRHISDMWNDRGWDARDKRLILEAVEYLINLTDEDYARQIVTYVKNLKMSEEDREMHVSVFERVYKAEGREEGMREGMQEGMREGMQKGMREGMQKGKQKGIQKGKREGLREGIYAGKKEMAKNLLARGVSPDIVAESSGLSRDDIKALMN
jgi:hypothetical protein